MKIQLKTLGDCLGPLNFTGACFDCGTFHSRNDYVLPIGHGDYVCRHCAKAREQRLDDELRQHIDSCNQLSQNEVTK